MNSLLIIILCHVKCKCKLRLTGKIPCLCQTKKLQKQVLSNDIHYTEVV